MKFSKIVIIMLVAGLAAAACTKDPVGDNNNLENQVNPNEGGTTPSTGSTSLDYSNLTASNHPRVIYTDEDFENIVETVEAGTNPYLTKLHNNIISKAKSYIGAADLEYKLDASGLRILDVSRSAQARILFCAYAYKTTGETSYLEQAEHDIQTVCGFTDWNAKKHFLDVGEMAAGVALGYDWLYNNLSSSTKSLVRTTFNNFVYTPIQTKEWSTDFYNVTTNWNQVCNGGVVCAALATYENNDSISKTLVQDAISSNVATLNEAYYPDGNYTEGYNYWGYGTLYEALMLTAFETALGYDGGLSDNSGFKKTGKYMIHMEGPSGYCFNYSDASQSYCGGMALWYFAWKFGDNSVLFLEKDRTSDYTSAENMGLMPLVAWYASKITVSDIQAPDEYIYHGDGNTPVVLVHDTWTMDENDKFLGIKGGKGTTSHAHLDAGSFVYDADGVRWASDYGKQGYSTLEPYISLWDTADGSERWTVFRYNNLNHNTLSVNDNYFKSAGFASFTDIIDSGDRKGATIDLTEPLANDLSSAVRTIYMEGDDLVIEDKITALSSKAATVRWTLVTMAQPTVEYGAVTLRFSKKIRYLTCSSSTGTKVTWNTWSTVGDHSWDADNTGYYECGYTVKLNAGTTADITVRLTPDDPLE